jgi:hypothetical protein
MYTGKPFMVTFVNFGLHCNKEFFEQPNKYRLLKEYALPDHFFFGATAPIWVLAYLHEILRFASVY